MFFHHNQFRLPNKPPVVVKNNEIAFKPEVRFLDIYIKKIECPCLFKVYMFE
jgi:hypothetical protein